MSVSNGGNSGQASDTSATAQRPPKLLSRTRESSRQTFPGYVATDRLHWLRAEYEAAAEKDKLRLATELLRRAEASGDKVEAVRWRAETDRLSPHIAPPPREKK